MDGGNRPPLPSFVEGDPNKTTTRDSNMPADVGNRERRAISPELDARIAAMDYTPEELANIETTIRFRSLDRPFKREDLVSIISKEYKATHHGMDALIAVTGDTKGYSQESMNDRRDTIVDIIAKGDRIWVYFRMDGHHTGRWFGQEASGKPISMHELGIFRFKDGLIIEAAFMGEELELARQLGIVPTTQPPKAAH